MAALPLLLGIRLVGWVAGSLRPPEKSALSGCPLRPPLQQLGGQRLLQGQARLER